MKVTAIYCDVDDFYKVFIPEWNKTLLETKKRQRKSTLSPAEIMTILILYHQSHYQNFKQFYLSYIPLILSKEFPHRVSYNRFVELEQEVLIPLCIYLQTRKVSSKGIAFVDSTSLKVCHNKRISQHKTFSDYAQRGKSSVDWYYGFKLHIMIDDVGELISFFITPTNIDDRKALKFIIKDLKGKLFGDKGYLSKDLQEALWKQGIQLITRVRKNMKEKVLESIDKILLCKRSIIETVIGQLKQLFQLEHSRHRRLIGFLVNTICALIAYSWQSKKTFS